MGVFRGVFKNDFGLSLKKFAEIIIPAPTNKTISQKIDLDIEI